MVAGRILVLITILVAVGTWAHRAAALALPPTLGAGGLEVGLRGGYVVGYDGRRGMEALLSVSVPLGRLASPRVFAEPAGERRADRRKAKSEEPAPEGAATPPAAPERFALDPAPPLLVTPELARATVRAALRATGAGATAARLGGLSSRARSSAALPELRLRASRTTDESLRLTPTTSDPYRYTQAGGVSVALEAQATWRLDRLVFADEEIQVEQLRGQRARTQARLVDQVLRALFAWQRALFSAAREDLPPEERALAALQVAEAEARLDVLTDGWFSAGREGPGARPRVRVDKRRHGDRGR